MKNNQGTLVAVVGNSGVGKTTFVNALCRTAGFSSALEQHATRPFQRRFAEDVERYALPNQFDYLLLRAEQERSIRNQPGVGVVDGGLDQDFYVFTRLFYQKGYLDQPEFELCARLYRFCRAALQQPDLTVWLQAPIPMIVERFTRRKRVLQIAQVEDLRQIDKLLNEWLTLSPPQALICADVSKEDISYTTVIAQVLQAIRCC